MTANDKHDNINIPAETLPDGALAQVTGGDKDNPATYAVGDWVKPLFSPGGSDVQYCVTAVLGSDQYQITEFECRRNVFNPKVNMITRCYTSPIPYSSAEILETADPPSWAELAMEYYETHKGGAL